MAIANFIEIRNDIYTVKYFIINILCIFIDAFFYPAIVKIVKDGTALVAYFLDSSMIFSLYLAGVMPTSSRNTL